MADVRCGANDLPEEVVNKCIGFTVNEIREVGQELLNIPDDAEAVVSGDSVNTEYRLQEGDTLEFVRASGSKGSDK
ncbi:hypothetical protein ACFL2R_03820 [Patescibacteria group bacterium]